MSASSTTTQHNNNPVVAWDGVDTVLLDMDGTLLDLAFDNYFWTEFIPAHYAQVRGLREKEARSTLLDRYRSIEGRLAWYCIDHWSEALDLDIRALKRTQRHRVCYLPGATDFLAWLREQDKRVLLVTNAHPFTLALKVAETDLDAHVHDMVSSHNFLAPKETGLFWHRFHVEEPFDPSRTLLVEDSVPVLQAATRFGLAATVAIRCPDTRHPPRQIDGFPSVDGVHELIDGREAAPEEIAKASLQP